ncbi:MAG: GLUG motif-containing protein [Planctomycetota bacterium]|jgi:hypothetical protein
MNGTRISSLLGKITVVLVICCCLPAQAKYGGGSGTPNDPYLIVDANQMNAIGADSSDWDKCFKLMADIDLSNFTGTSFNIIGDYVGWGDPANKPFTGVFDGSSHKISNFTYSVTGNSYIGLFSLVAGTNAVIKDLCLINPNVNVQTGGGAASLVGQMQDGTIINCYVKGGSIAAETWVGGLVGLNLEGTITNCYAETSVSGVEVIGGLVAGNWNGLGTIYNSYSESSVSGNSRVGGLLGHHSGTITNCYASGSVAGSTGVGGLVGYHDGGSYIKSFWDSDINPGINGIGNTSNPEVIGKPTVNMQNETTFTSAGWDFVGETTNGTEDIWKIRGTDYPRLSWEKYGGGTGEPNDPYLIFDANQMNAIGADSDDWDEHFLLCADIDLSIFTGTEFNIIGNDSNAFTGVFDGNEHVISNFTYTGTGEVEVGIFGSVGDFYGGYGRVKSLGLRDPNIHAGHGAALVGLIMSGSISNCYVQGGSVKLDIGGGGLVGMIASQVFTPSPITNCYVTCSVSGNSMVGGLVGMAGVPAVITKCYANGRVSGGTYIGGLVGASQGGTISNCYATGNVSGDSKVGGLVGYFYHNEISNCYSAGSVVGTTDVGGLIGYHDSGSYIKSFWDSDINSGLNGIGNTTNPDVIGESTINMQTESTFTSAGWDFVGETANGTEDIWKIREMDYPRLSWEQYVGSGGTGEPNDPYLIYTAEQMNAIGADSNGWDKHFLLCADIDLSGFTGTSFNIIGYFVDWFSPDNKPFTGVFDGNGHTISNFTYNSTGTDHIGLFGFLGDFFGGHGEVRNLGLINPDIDAGTGDYVGSLSGVVYGTVSNCYVQGGRITGDVDVGGLIGSTGFAAYHPWPGGSAINCHANCIVSGNSSVGGLEGGNYGGIVSGCYSKGSVEGNYEIGGLVGSNRNYDYNVDSIIFNSYSRASVTGTSDIGGLAGHNSWGSTISNCYSAGNVTGTTETGGLVGECYDSNNVADSFWDVYTSGQTTSEGGTPKTTLEMINPNTFMDAGWDFVGKPDGPSDIWADPVGGGYPILWWQLSPLPALPGFSDGTGKADDPYLISTAAELNSIGYNPRLMDAHFKLINDIDLTAVDFFIIASKMYPFAGTFDGGGYEVSNFTYNSTGLDNIGFFGVVEGEKAKIKNLGLKNPNVDAGTNAYAAGSLVGLLTGGATLSNCYAEGGSVSGDDDVGGLVGSVGLWGVSSPISLITNCYATVVVTGDLSVGGLMGANYRGNILDCHATGEVTGGFAGGLVGFYSSSGDVVRSYATGDVSGHHGVGGLVGHISSGQISQCYATGSVTGTGLGAGGLVGSNFGTITDSYSTGTVTGNERVGGLAGSNYEVITNCYSIGSVSGNEEVGCLIGRVFGSPAPVTTASFWDSQTALPTTGSAGGTGKTTAQMQTESTFTGWDFVLESGNGTDDVWTINEHVDYPKHVWKLVRFVDSDGVDFKDYSYFANHWMLTDCSNINNCNGTDLDFSNTVDRKDLRIFADNWLSGF